MPRAFSAESAWPQVWDSRCGSRTGVAAPLVGTPPHPPATAHPPPCCPDLSEAAEARGLAILDPSVLPGRTGGRRCQRF